MGEGETKIELIHHRDANSVNHGPAGLLNPIHMWSFLRIRPKWIKDTVCRKNVMDLKVFFLTLS